MAINKNQSITMNFEIRINDDIIESNLDKEPVKLIYGIGQILEGLEVRIKNMTEGETKEIKVPAYEAYGDYDKELAETLPIGEFDGIDLEIGMTLEADDDNGEVIKATVTEVTQDDVTVDYNHPLAGCDLDFTVVIKKID